MNGNPTAIKTIRAEIDAVEAAWKALEALRGWPFGADVPLTADMPEGSVNFKRAVTVGNYYADYRVTSDECGVFRRVGKAIADAQLIIFHVDRTNGAYKPGAYVDSVSTAHGWAIHVRCCPRGQNPWGIEQ